MFKTKEDKAVFDKQFWAGSIPSVIALFFIFNILILCWHKNFEIERKNNLLQNAEKYSSKDTSHIRYDLSTGGDFFKYMNCIPDATKNHLVILTGMSQMYAINEERAGDQTISEWMDDSLRKKGIRVFGVAAPNITNEEVLLLLLSLSIDPKTKPRIFIYGICFDKFRNIDIRPEYQQLFLKLPGLANSWKNASRAFESQYPLASQKMTSTLDSLNEIKNETGGIEERFRNAAFAYVPMIRYAKDINAVLQMKIFTFRNWLFHIRPTSKRAIIESRYEMNRQFLDLMCDAAKKNNIKLIFYIVPLNLQAENPYVPEQYRQFKQWMGELCRKRHIPFGNLESAVPSVYWGQFMGGADFKHFKGEGHRITSEALLKEFKHIFDNI